MLKIKFGIYTANTAAFFVTSDLKQKTVTFIVFVQFLWSFCQIVGNIMNIKKKGIAGRWKKGNRALRPAKYV